MQEDIRIRRDIFRNDVYIAGNKMGALGRFATQKKFSLEQTICVAPPGERSSLETWSNRINSHKVERVETDTKPDYLKYILHRGRFKETRERDRKREFLLKEKRFHPTGWGESFDPNDQLVILQNSPQKRERTHRRVKNNGGNDIGDILWRGKIKTKKDATRREKERNTP